MFVITEGIGDSEGERMAFVGLFQDRCHGSFHIHHGVESGPQIVKRFYLLQKCGKKVMRNLCGIGMIWEHGEDVE